MVRMAVVGLGKMGLTHYALVNAHPRVRVEAVCDTAGYVLGTLNKHTNVRTFSDYDTLLRDTELDAVLIATPPGSHKEMAEKALMQGLHVFCEKPFCLSPADGRSLAMLGRERGLVTQVGYHYRFVGAFQEVKRLLEFGAIGDVTHALAEAYGPLLLRPNTSTWRTQRTAGGGCLYDYAAHPINLVNWYLGSPQRVGGTVLNGVFSGEDEVFSTLYFENNRSAQLSVNWSDESCRRMTTKISIWGSMGHIYADRQECRVYLRTNARIPESYKPGWNVRYTTDLTQPVWFYIRGEEYSAQLDYFVNSIESKSTVNVNSFASAAETDSVISMIVGDAEKSQLSGLSDGAHEYPKPKRNSLFFWRKAAEKRAV